MPLNVERVYIEQLIEDLKEITDNIKDEELEKFNGKLDEFLDPYRYLLDEIL